MESPVNDELRDKWQDVLDTCDPEDWVTRNLVEEFLEDLTWAT